MAILSYGFMDFCLNWMEVIYFLILKKQDEVSS